MSRADKRDTKIREGLETIGAEVAVINVRLPLIRLAVEHARLRTGLDTLLVPALVNADEVLKSTDEIRRQISAVLERLKQ